MADLFVSHFNYYAVIVLMMTGLYIVFATGNMVKRLVGLGVFQTSVFLFYITLGKVAGGIPPILPEDKAHGGGHGGEYGEAEHATPHAAPPTPGVPADAVHSGAYPPTYAEAGHGAAGAGEIVYSNPLPHVLILTAIVVGVATLAVGLALVVRIREAYGTIEDDDINQAEYDAEVEGADA